jgi:uncharacterized phage infection (PIP) family protein YhgE
MKLGYPDDMKDFEEEKSVKEVLEDGKQAIEEKEKAIDEARERNREKFSADSQERQKLNELVEALGIKTMSEDIDNLKATVKAIAEKLSESIEAINKQNEILSNGIQAPGIPDQSQGIAQGLTPEKIEMLSNVFDKLMAVFRPPAAPAGPTTITQEFINKKMEAGILDDLETGENIRKYISDSLKKKATRTVVNEALGGIGEAPGVDHGPT